MNLKNHSDDDDDDDQIKNHNTYKNDDDDGDKFTNARKKKISVSQVDQRQKNLIIFSLNNTRKLI